MKSLIALDKNNHAFTTTLIIAEGVEIEHRAVIQLLKTHEIDVKSLDISAFLMRIKKAKKQGKPTTYFELSEVQATFLITLMKNSKIVISFKKTLTIEFFRMRKHLLQIATQQTNEQWIEQRTAGKIARRIETNVIKDFIAYAKKQGGSEGGCDLYYSNISKMENKAIFVVERKYPNLRDVLGVTDLSTIQKADIIVSRALRDGMNDKKHYKDIYKMAKDRVEMFAELIGKNPIKLLNKDDN